MIWKIHCHWNLSFSTFTFFNFSHFPQHFHFPGIVLFSQHTGFSFYTFTQLRGQTTKRNWVRLIKQRPHCHNRSVKTYLQYFQITSIDISKCSKCLLFEKVGEPFAIFWHHWSGFLRGRRFFGRWWEEVNVYLFSSAHCSAINTINGPSY